MAALKINDSKFERAEVINHLLYPLKGISAGADRDKSELARIVRDKPSELLAVGLIRVEVFAPECSNPEQGTWSVGRFKVWVDKDSGVPVDSSTVHILSQFPGDPDKLTRKDMISLLPPTYWAREEDAAVLKKLFQDAGPLHTWPVAE